MEFIKQNKMTKYEWQSTETRVSPDELIILNMIKNGLYNTDISVDTHKTINDIIKIDNAHKDYHIYNIFISPYISNKYSKYISFDIHDKNKKINKKLQKSDLYRLNNKNIDISPSIEILLIDLLKKYIKKKNIKYYFNIKYLLKIYNDKLNTYVKQILLKYIGNDSNIYTPIDVLKDSNDLLENNKIFNYKKLTLYDHQKEIYNIFNKDNCIPSLIYYIAPTSSGKTLTPIGLCEKYKIIFICASRHIGISLSKSCVNVGTKIGFAFGCNTINDIRLHYFSVSKYTPDKIPIHSDGSKVQILISDMISYEFAMEYMLQFNDASNIILFWDEPTISMDKDTHCLHDIIKHNWDKNVIPNIILSSATLPNNLQSIVDNYKIKFNGTHHVIETNDEFTNLTLVDNDGYVIMPHNFIESSNFKYFYEKMGKKYIKFLSVDECCKYILNSEYLNEFNYNIDNISARCVKLFYYDILLKSNTFNKSTTHIYDNSLLLTSSSSKNIKHGPGLIITTNDNDITYLTDKLLEQSNINNIITKKIEENMDFNSKLFTLIDKLSQDLEDKLSKFEGKDKIMENQRFDTPTKDLMNKIKKLEGQYKNIQLGAAYIPNSYEHYVKWNKLDDYSKLDLHCSDIEDKYIKNIIETNIDVKYKILLLMGIGVLDNSNIILTNIVKELADLKKLFIVIASSDFIYGMNYQFSQCYLYGDNNNISQEKIIQATGRIGRKDKNKTFLFRFINKEHINILFNSNDDIESKNMNKLFGANN